MGGLFLLYRFNEPPSGPISIHIAGMLEKEIADFPADADGVPIPLSSSPKRRGWRNVQNPIYLETPAVCSMIDR